MPIRLLTCMARLTSQVLLVRALDPEGSLQKCAKPRKGVQKRVAIAE